MNNLKKISKSPPGWSDWIEEQKSEGMTADEAFGIAWKQHNKGTKPPSKKKKKKKSNIETIRSIKSSSSMLLKKEDLNAFREKTFSISRYEYEKAEEFSKKRNLPPEEIKACKAIIDAYLNRQRASHNDILILNKLIREDVLTKNSGLKKTSKRFPYIFDKHQPQWKFDKITGKMIFDEEELEKVGKKSNINKRR